MSSSEWKEVKLCDVISFKNGKKKPSSYGKVPIYGGNGILGFTNEFNNKNTVVIGRVGAYCGSVNYEPRECWISDNAISAKPIGDNDVQYAYYVLKSLKLNERRIGTGQPLLTQSILNSIKINYPDAKNQKAIAATLSCLDDKIELNNKINHNLEQMAQAVFKSWFIDFEPFSGNKPSDWRIGTISDVADDIVCGKTPSTKVSEYYGNDLPFITIPDMHGKTYVTTTERSLSTTGADSQGNKTIPPDSVCVSCIATAGLVVLTTAPSQTNQQINSIVCRKGISPFYIYLAMIEMADHIKMLGSSGSTTNNLNKGQFAKIKILIPENSVIDKFASIVSPMFESIKRNQQETECLESLRDTLIPKLMSGEIAVSDVNI